MTKWMFLLVSAALLGSQGANAALRVEEILNAEDINRVVADRDFFGRRTWSNPEGPWNPFDQKYSEVFLRGRTQVITYDEAIHGAMHASFAMAFGVEQLLRTDLGQYEALGNLLPSINLTLEDGVSVGVASVFGGLFNFLSPANWLNLARSHLQYEIGKLQVTKSAVDTYLNIQQVFLDLRRVVLNVEILSFYLSHLQILAESALSISDQDRLILRALYSDLAIDLAFSINRIGIHHNNLAEAMAVLQDAGGNYSVSLLRVDLIDNFSRTLRPYDQLGERYATKEIFVRDALVHSIEVQIVQELASLAKYRIGIRSTGDLLSDESSGTEVGVGVRFGFGTIPRVLIAKSYARTAEIDVAAGVLGLLDTARRAYGNYGNAIRVLDQARQSVEVHRGLFYPLLDRLAAGEHDVIDAKFITYLRNLVEAEVRQNNQLHRGLREQAIMERYLLLHLDVAGRYLPSNTDIDSALHKMKNGNQAIQLRSLSAYLTHLRGNSELKDFLEGRVLRRTWVDFGARTVKDLVADHFDLLLDSKGRSTEFFRILRKYVEDNGILLKAWQKEQLDYLCVTGPILRWFRKGPERLASQDPLALGQDKKDD